MSPALAGRFSTTAPPGKPSWSFLIGELKGKELRVSGKEISVLKFELYHISKGSAVSIASHRPGEGVSRFTGHVTDDRGWSTTGPSLPPVGCWAKVQRSAHFMLKAVLCLGAECSGPQAVQSEPCILG